MLKHGTNENGEFYEIKRGSRTLLIQSNRLGVWHAYVNCGWKQSFTHRESAEHWICEQGRVSITDVVELGHIVPPSTAGAKRKG